jgi:hypothetical protein
VGEGGAGSQPSILGVDEDLQQAGRAVPVSLQDAVEVGRRGDGSVGTDVSGGSHVTSMRPGRGWFALDQKMLLDQVALRRS